MKKKREKATKKGALLYDKIKGRLIKQNGDQKQNETYSLVYTSVNFIMVASSYSWNLRYLPKALG